MQQVRRRMGHISLEALLKKKQLLMIYAYDNYHFGSVLVDHLQSKASRRCGSCLKGHVRATMVKILEASLKYLPIPHIAYPCVCPPPTAQRL